eukprot:TRINITY_DN4783_c0_g1_i2.p2 TRINITY_DN4783_c0_g1~~TRINITY_DN4783_c0_g1_i2.p2  ORF type:complete len:143 (+),score=38.87 TRINITY_DN4783_c0_g1_i2:506-934(+)
MRQIDLVPQDQKWAAGKLLTRQQRLQLRLSFWEALAIVCVDHVYDGIHTSQVVVPQSTSTAVTPKVVCLDPKVPDFKFLHVGVIGRLMGREFCILEHMKHSGFAGIVQSQDCLLYTSDAADDLLCVDLGGRRIIKKKNQVLY